MATSKFKFLERYPKILNVVIKPIDVKKSSGYGSINDCYLATALKRMRYRNPVVGADNVDFYA